MELTNPDKRITVRNLYDFKQQYDAEMEHRLSSKQDLIDDLSTIRNGAAAGAKAAPQATTYSKSETYSKPETDAAVAAEASRAAAAESANAEAVVAERQQRAAADEALQRIIGAMEALIPVAATPENQLADKGFVNSSVATSTATYRGSYNLVTDLHLTKAEYMEVPDALGNVIATADSNDYAYVQIPVDDSTPSLIEEVRRFKYNGGWVFEYTLNNSGFTAAQWEALNSTITSGLVAKLADLPTLNGLLDMLLAKQDVIDSVHKLDADLLKNGSGNKVFTSDEKAKLDDIETGAQVNVSPDWDAPDGEPGAILHKPTIPSEQVQSDWAEENRNSKAYIFNKPTTMGASGAAHKGGLVPDTPSAAGTTKFLREDGTWSEPEGGGDVSGKEDMLSVCGELQTTDFLAEASKYYNVQVDDGDAVTVTLATPQDGTYVSRVMFLAAVGDAASLSFESENGEPVLCPADIAGKMLFHVTAMYDGLCWIVLATELSGVKPSDGAYWRLLMNYSQEQNGMVLVNAYGNIVKLDLSGEYYYISSDLERGIKLNDWNDSRPQDMPLSKQYFGYEETLVTKDGASHLFTVGGTEYALDADAGTLTPTPDAWKQKEGLCWSGEVSDYSGTYSVLLNACGNVLLLDGVKAVRKEQDGNVSVTESWNISSISMEQHGKENVPATMSGSAWLFTYVGTEYTVSDGTITPDVKDVFA